MSGALPAAGSTPVGRARELEMIRGALATGRSILLEGPAGVGKSTLLRAVAAASGRPLFFVEGNAGLSLAGLIGHHDPAAVLRGGWEAEDFVAGPLTLAMRAGGILYVEEINRAQPDVLNALIGPLADGVLEVPRLGTITADSGFRLVAAMNPSDDAGVTPLSSALRDRLVRVHVGYATQEEELRIVGERAGAAPRWLQEGAVTLTRATRVHPELERGSSVRGAIDLVAVACRLADLRRLPLDEPSGATFDAVAVAALWALSGRIAVTPSSPTTPEAVLRELCEDVFLLARRPRDAGGSELAGENALVSSVGGRKRRTARVRRLSRADVPDHVAWPKPGRVDEAPRLLRADEVVATSAGGGPASSRSADGALPEGEPLRVDELLEGPGDAGADEGRRAAADAGDADKQLDAVARRLAQELVLSLARRTSARRTGPGRLESVRYRRSSTELDLDRTLDELIGNPVPDDEDFWVRERVRTKRAVVLMLDVSGSMRGPKLTTAAVAAAALQHAAVDDDVAVVAFWREAAVLQAMAEKKPAEWLVPRILGLRARGLTNLRFGLETGLRELSRSAAREQVAVLFSDGGHNLGDDPLEVARQFDTLHVIGTSLADSRVRACQELAEAGGGRCVFAEAPEDVPAAIERCLGQP